MTSPHFVVIGECVADVVRTDGAPDVVHPGGSPANVAYGLGRLGEPVALLTQLADDRYGRLIRAHLESAGVTLLSPAASGDAPRTPSAVVRLDEQGRAQYAFDIGWTLPPVELPCSPRHLHIGSIAAVTAPGAAAVLALVERWSGRAGVSYDPNVRPALMGEHDEAVRRVERCVALSDLVKASDEDLDWLYPGRDPEEVARHWLGLGPATVAVTRGPAGAFALTADGRRVEAPARTVEVADTVGAGDAFTAALLHARRTGAGLDAALACATAAATLTVTRPGATPPDAAELASALA
ncbi:fructokinase [Streptomyces sp. TLI_053]|uniref:carbohydrate kinase family protein n=1 Tax=Streptomyces sp. TLI_053 TaxID=1855352 RepID=UPI00087A4383|nr:carbohydrate kinase [Streptomyces sp. TLI_053]SDT82370.1 fructokinase [Streptomyces sp. TLI_053]